jgi:hypothetical protein
MNTYESPRCRCRSRQQVDDLRLHADVERETGSSQMISFGSTASARAMPMRWRWPPENSCG